MFVSESDDIIRDHVVVHLVVMVRGHVVSELYQIAIPLLRDLISSAGSSPVQLVPQQAMHHYHVLLCGFSLITNLDMR
jgi:hypothetical protein